MIEERKVYGSLDIAKFVMAVLILVGHISNEWAHTTGIWHYILACNFTVPSFFAISGFLFFSKIKVLNDRSERISYYKTWSLRVIKMYLVWTLIYFVFILINWVRHGVGINDILFFVMKSVTFSSYATIWFLPALWMGVTVCFFLFEYCRKKEFVYCIIAGLWVIGLLNDPYSSLILPRSHFLTSIHDAYLRVFLTFRDGVFYAAVYILIGYYVSQRKKNMSLIASGVGIVFSQILFLIEAIIMKRINPTSNTDMAIMLVPSVYFILLFLVNWDVKGSELLKKLRNYSMLIFLGQRLFLSAMPSVLPETVSNNILALPQITIYCIFVLSTILFAVIIEKLSGRFAFLKLLM